VKRGGDYSKRGGEGAVNLDHADLACEMQTVDSCDNVNEDGNPVCEKMLDEHMVQLQRTFELPTSPADCTVGVPSLYTSRFNAVRPRNFRLTREQEIHRHAGPQAHSSADKVPCFRWGEHPYPDYKSPVDEPVFLFSCKEIDSDPAVILLRQLLTRRSNTTADENR
jgi:hypothetical protein